MSFNELLGDKPKPAGYMNAFRVPPGISSVMNTILFPWVKWVVHFSTLLCSRLRSVL